MGMTEQDLMAMRDELIQKKQMLDAANAELVAKAQAMNDTGDAYGAIPNMGGARALAGIGLPMAGAVGGGMLGGGRRGVVLGGLAGLAGGALANTAITSHLNKKYPEREGLFDAHQQAIDDFEDNFNGPYSDAQEAYGYAKEDAVDAALSQPGDWTQATQGTEGFPADDFQSAILGKRRSLREELLAEQARQQALAKHEQKLRDLDVQERQSGLTTSNKGHSLSDEELKKQQLKNQEREFNLAQLTAAQQQEQPEEEDPQAQQ